MFGILGTHIRAQGGAEVAAAPSAAAHVAGPCYSRCCCCLLDFWLLAGDTLTTKITHPKGLDVPNQQEEV